MGSPHLDDTWSQTGGVLSHPMDDLVFVKALEGLADLDEDRPDSLLWETLPAAVGALQLLEEVSIAHELRDLQRRRV